MGQKYAEYDSTGAIVAFYDSVDSPIPSDVTSVIEITDTEWLECITTQSYTVADGALVAPVASTDAELLAAAQSLQISVLSRGCQASIIDGFSSSALGSAYNYPSTMQDQSNQSAVANCTAGGHLWCESGSAWGFTQHTQTQAQAVVASFVAWLNSCQSQLVTLTASVDAATTVDAVEAIVWTNP